MAPFSRGNVTIASSDTADNPIISPNWLLDPRDQEIAVAGFKRARQVFETDSIRKTVNGGAEFFPGAKVKSDADILKVIMQTASTIDHAAGTCAMGKKTDKNAVIDSKARVFGVTGLRVVDASSFPLLPPGHPQGTICKSRLVFLYCVLFSMKSVLMSPQMLWLRKLWITCYTIVEHHYFEDQLDCSLLDYIPTSIAWK